ncbi:Uncharacterised protein g3291 [Pycnogonum litorale]
MEATFLILLMTTQLLPTTYSLPYDEMLRREENSAMELSRQRRQINNINDYLRTILVNFRSQMKTGIPELKIPILDPFVIGNKNFQKKESSYFYTMKVTDAKVKGLYGFQIKKLDLSLSKLKFTIKLKIPKISVGGLYDLDAKFYSIIPIYGKGIFGITVRNLEFFTSVGVTVTPKGKAILQEPPNLGVEFGSLKINFRNLLGGGTLGSFINNILSAAGPTVFDKLKPKLLKKVKHSLFKKLNKSLSKIDITKFVG